jgi:hypothetical protein
MLMVVDDVAEATEVQMADALTRARLCENIATAFGAPPTRRSWPGLITAVAPCSACRPPPWHTSCR